MWTLSSLSIICTFSLLYFIFTILSSFFIISTISGTTSSKYSRGHFSSASANIVWFVYPVIAVTIFTDSSKEILYSSVIILINSGITILG